MGNPLRPETLPLPPITTVEAVGIAAQDQWIYQVLGPLWLGLPRDDGHVSGFQARGRCHE